MRTALTGLLTREDVVSVLGEIDDETIAAVIATGAGMEELVEAYLWEASDGEALPDAEQPTGTVEVLCDILDWSGQWWEPRT